MDGYVKSYGCLCVLQELVGGVCKEKTETMNEKKIENTPKKERRVQRSAQSCKDISVFFLFFDSFFLFCCCCSVEELSSRASF